MNACTHEEQEIDCKVAYMSDSGSWMLEVIVTCKMCRKPFRFLGTDAGISFTRPMVDVSGTTIHLPMEPEGIPQLRTSLTYELEHPFSLPHTPVKES